VAVLSGFGGAIPLWAGPIHEKLTKSIPQGGVLWVFALKK
jgi:alcohol dehydrogenase (cytochrome c)